MTSTAVRDPVLEEMWAIKREIAAEYSSLDAYFQSYVDEQNEREQQGVKFVIFPPRPVDNFFEKPAADSSAPCGLI